MHKPLNRNQLLPLVTIFLVSLAMVGCEEDYDREVAKERRGEERVEDSEEKENSDEHGHEIAPGSKTGRGRQNAAQWWTYAHNGPAHWGEFSKTCDRGHAQSPVNIVPGRTVSMNHTYDLHLKEDTHTYAKVIDNGHSIKVTPRHGGNISFHGEKFQLIQFHFHGKSEHTIDGKRYDLVAHMVHQNAKTLQLAVVAVFFRKGKNNALLDNILGGIGKEIRVDPQDLLPEDTQHYFHYIGSLTTPPCTENVQWYLLKRPATASQDQIDAFRKYYVDNERPVQELYDRLVEGN